MYLCRTYLHILSIKNILHKGIKELKLFKQTNKNSQRFMLNEKLLFFTNGKQSGIKFT